VPDQQRGQAVPLVTLVMALAIGAVVVIGRLGATAVALAEARTAADASALAGARGGRAAAEALARRNGGTVVTFRPVGAAVEVVVSVRGRRAIARARWSP
jgi:hypothetical protein